MERCPKSQRELLLQSLKETVSFFQWPQWLGLGGDRLPVQTAADAQCAREGSSISLIALLIFFSHMIFFQLELLMASVMLQ